MKFSDIRPPVMKLIGSNHCSYKPFAKRTDCLKCSIKSSFRVLGKTKSMVAERKLKDELTLAKMAKLFQILFHVTL